MVIVSQIILPVVLAVGCSAQKPVVKPDAAAQGLATPGPKASAPPERDPPGLPHSLCPSEGAGTDLVVVEHDGKFCGCHNGKLYCRTMDDRCFAEGKWYQEGGIFTHRSYACTCENPPTWSCDTVGPVNKGVDCPQFFLLNVIHFDLGSSKLSPAAHARVQRMATDLAERPLAQYVTLRAQADPSEPKAEWLAQRRAEEILAALIKLGVERDRVRIENLGINPVPLPQGVPACSDTSALNPSPKVIFYFSPADNVR